MRLVVAQLRMRSDATGERILRSDEVPILAEVPHVAASSNGHAPVEEVAVPAPRPARVRQSIGSWFRSGGRRRILITGLALANVIVLSVLSRNKFFATKTALGEIAPDLPATVAVFSFHGRAGGLTGELGRATAELLSTSLDGGTGFTALAAPLDAQPSVRASGDSTTVDKDAAARAAERLGARFFVLGHIV